MQKVCFVGMLLLVACAWSASASCAQDGTIAGEVVDAVTGEALPRANVVLIELDRGVPADASGRFAFEAVPAGVYTIAVSYIGYERYEREISVDAGQRVQLEVPMERSGVEAGELVVEGLRATDIRDLGTARISGADIQEMPSVLEPDLFRTLQLLPGVQSASDFSSSLYIRGGTPDQTLILVDGAPVYNPSHVFGFFSTFNPDVVEEAQVYKGGYPASYGGRLGSVVDITNRRGDSDEVGGTLALGLLASRVSLQGPLAHGSYIIAARRSTLEPLFALLNAADVEGIPHGFYFYDLNAKITVDLSDRDRLTASAYTGQDNLDYPFLDDARFDVSYGNQAASLRWRRLLSDEVFATVTAMASNYSSHPSATVAATDFEQVNDVWDYGLKADISAEVGGHRLDAGADIGSFSFQLQNSFDRQVRLESSVRSSYISGYVQDTFEPRAGWQITAGLRGNYFGQGGHWRLNPRLSVERRLGSDIRLQLGYGRYSQYLTLVSSELFSAFDVWLTTGEGVPPSYGDQLVAGLKADLPYGLELDVEAYGRTMHQLFEVDPLLPDVTGMDYDEAFHFGDGYAYGAEVFLRRDHGRFSGFLSYALAWTWRRFDGFEGGSFYQPKFDRRHDLNMTGRYRLSPSWDATGVLALASGQPYTEPYAQYWVETPFNNEPQPVLLSEFNQARLPVYHRLDLGVERRGRFFGRADYELQLQVINAYGRRNVWFYLFSGGEDGELERTAVPQIPVPLPNISLTLRF